MRVFKLFRDIQERFSSSQLSDLTVLVRTRMSARAVVNLLERDLVPAIRVNVIVSDGLRGVKDRVRTWW